MKTDTTKFKLTKKRTARWGVTLPEMLVAISITVMMLGATGMILKSSSQASGKATRYNNMMRHVRAITQQLDRDFRGIRMDMPMAIVFEQDNANIRYDRICFFANGDFQDIEGGTGNMARIFYGQASDTFTIPDDSDAPMRKILTRRCKIMTGNDSAPKPGGWGGYTPQEYDNFPFEYASVAFWKNADITDYQDMYFNEGQSVIVSFVIRPDIEQVKTDLNPYALQRLYLLPDVTDFKIQMWFDDAGPPVDGRWFPDDNDLTTLSISNSMAFFWNVAGQLNTPIMIGTTEWWSEDALLAGGWANARPRALKFTFTLYDKNRRHFPDGRTFSYIIKL